MTRMDLSRAVWRKSSRSAGNGGSDKCVEVAALGDGQIAVRNSKRPNEAVLFITRPEMTAWIQAVKHQQFDDLT